MSTQHYYTCAICGAQSLVQGAGQPAHECSCGTRHRLCWPCCNRYTIPWDWDIRETPLEVCPVSDEFRVADALMREDGPAGNQHTNADPERVKRITERRKQIFTQKMLKQFAKEGRSVTLYLDGEESA